MSLNTPLRTVFQVTAEHLERTACPCQSRHLRRCRHIKRLNCCARTFYWLLSVLRTVLWLRDFRVISLPEKSPCSLSTSCQLKPLISYITLHSACCNGYYTMYVLLKAHFRLHGQSKLIFSFCSFLWSFSKQTSSRVIFNVPLLCQPLQNRKEKFYSICFIVVNSSKQERRKKLHVKKQNHRGATSKLLGGPDLHQDREANV